MSAESLMQVHVGLAIAAAIGAPIAFGFARSFWIN
jgi:ABC-type nitrate/sulfonate/bicarbonate transport system permease component